MAGTLQRQVDTHAKPSSRGPVTETGDSRQLDSGFTACRRLSSERDLDGAPSLLREPS